MRLQAGDKSDKLKIRELTEQVKNTLLKNNVSRDF